MKFVLIDRLVRLEPARCGRATKNLSLAEEYLADHFPKFPVLPGVLMIEAMVQTAAWVVRASEDFAHSIVVLREAKNVSYGSFVSPGDTMQIDVEALKLTDQQSTFKGQCSVAGKNVVRGRLELEHYNIVDRYPGLEDQDRQLTEHFRSQFSLLGGPQAIDAQCDDEGTGQAE